MTKRRPPPRLPKILLDELEGLPWRLELGTKHWHLRVGPDSQLIAILPLARMSENANRNTLATRAAIRKYKENRK